MSAAGAVMSRRAVIHSSQARSVLGEDLRAGDVLATGVVLEVARDDAARDVRLEMPGAEVHYVGFDELVLVLATVDEALLDGISLGTYVARAETRPPQGLRLVPEIPPEIEPMSTPGGGSSSEPGVGSVPSAREGKTNRGPLGQYDESVRHFVDTCPIHGESTFAAHKAGRRRNGEQRWNIRCLACHSDYNLGRRER